MLLKKQSTLRRHRTRELAESAPWWVGSAGKVKITKDVEPMPRTSLVTKTARFLTLAPPRVRWRRSQIWTGLVLRRSFASIEFVDNHRSSDIAHACADMTLAAALGARLPVHNTAVAVSDFIRWGWDRPAAPVESWARAIDELSDRGLLL